MSRRIGGAFAAIAALAVPLTLAAAGPATALEPVDEGEGFWMQAAFAFDRAPNQWPGDQELVFFRVVDTQPAGDDVLNPTDDPEAFPLEVCGSQTVQVDNIFVTPDDAQPEVGTLYAAPFKENQGWNVRGAGHFAPATDPAIDCTTTPVIPAVVDVCEPLDGPTGDYVTIPESTGVEYRIDGAVVAAGQYPLGDQAITVTATGTEGITLEGTTEWTLSASKVDCVAPATPVKPGEPTPSDVCEPADGGATQDTIAIPTTEGIDFQIDGVTVTGTVPAEGTSITVTAVAKDGSVLDGTSEWTFTFTKDACVTPPPPVTPTTPPTTPTTPPAAPNEPVSGEITTADVCEPGDGTTNDTITIPAIPGIEFAIDGTVVEAGDHAATGTTHVVTAKALPDYEVTGPAEWTFEFTKDACEAGVIPPAPSTTPAPVTAGPDELATTGADDVMPLGLAAIALLTLGAGLVAARRMRGANS